MEWAACLCSLAVPTPSAVVAETESVLPGFGSRLPPAPLFSFVSDARGHYLQRPGVSQMLLQAWAGQGAWRATQDLVSATELRVTLGESLNFLPLR